MDGMAATFSEHLAELHSRRLESFYGGWEGGGTSILIGVLQGLFGSFAREC